MNQKEPDSAQPDFWSQRYLSGRIPWQLDHIPARLNALIRSLPFGSKVLIPGCGEDSGTIDTFHRGGHQATAIDFSPVAVEHTKKALLELGGKIILGDFFTHDFGT